MPTDLAIDVYFGKTQRHDSGTVKTDVCGYSK